MAGVLEIIIFLCELSVVLCCEGGVVCYFLNILYNRAAEAEVSGGCIVIYNFLCIFSLEGRVHNVRVECMI